MNFKKQTPSKPEPKTPSFHAYVVSEVKGEGQKGYWTKIGAFFAHEDGDGGTLVLEAVPLTGRIVLRAPKADA
ncbi:hypothetical protein ASG42_26515 [Rhizobium sp. Leaf391]|uniref:hypothetical protein n=1 Tax=Rhizobium sp. Leaf391 TaxID=1736360 RepID=UPI0007133405|nr:hypothetical protein [Rhizobium sp. Leaf391]KQT01573.1 hypothetical protein ASG42_26515 [Rhizobium sp. Leaf391]